MFDICIQTEEEQLERLKSKPGQTSVVSAFSKRREISSQEGFIDTLKELQEAVESESECKCKCSEMKEMYPSLFED